MEIRSLSSVFNCCGSFQLFSMVFFRFWLFLIASGRFRSFLVVVGCSRASLAIFSNVAPRRSPCAADCSQPGLFCATLYKTRFRPTGPKPEWHSQRYARFVFGRLVPNQTGFRNVMEEPYSADWSQTGDVIKDLYSADWCQTGLDLVKQQEKAGTWPIGNKLDWFP